MYIEDTLGRHDLEYVWRLHQFHHRVAHGDFLRGVPGGAVGCRPAPPGR